MKGTTKLKDPGSFGNMNADLGLFNQLLQMVDGDWSDSIQGICDHIRDHFSATCVFMSVFDRNYNEFIYIAYSITRKMEEAVLKSGMPTGRIEISENIKKILNSEKNLLEYGIFTDIAIERFTNGFFNNDEEQAGRLIRRMKLKSVFSVPVLTHNKSYKCYFHIISDREIKDPERDSINSYITQLNVALEIVFLVRELYIRATHDGLTRLFNHKQGYLLLSRELDRVYRNKQPLCVVMADIDFFKTINDTYGHKAGDEVLQWLAGMFLQKLRRLDIISRYGGEEFLLVLPDTNIERTVDVLRRLKDGIQEHEFASGGNRFTVTMSFGVAQYNSKHHKDADTLLVDADKLLYRAKNSGRNRIEFK